jgi:hypothetical protein
MPATLGARMQFVVDGLGFGVIVCGPPILSCVVGCECSGESLCILAPKVTGIA